MVQACSAPYNHKYINILYRTNGGQVSTECIKEEGCDAIVEPIYVSDCLDFALLSISCQDKDLNGLHRVMGLVSVLGTASCANVIISQMWMMNGLSKEWKRF